ncbi:hypothetical protein [Pseudomonas sp. BAY1663]|uniref:hypothetical protein n=1 Tax=Pseudomonas sp. BAY1663 TaxID=1439940 RepID=UPI00268B4E75
MTHLQSKQMHLSARERAWLPWFGGTGKLAMRWSCWLNRGVYPVIEQVFEGVAQSRARILQNWVGAHWDHLADLADSLGESLAHVDVDTLEKKRIQLPDLSELFVIDPQAGCWPPLVPPMSGNRTSTARPWRRACSGRSCMALIAIR